jgi:hypothetical protein
MAKLIEVTIDNGNGKTEKVMINEAYIISIRADVFRGGAAIMTTGGVVPTTESYNELHNMIQESVIHTEH